MKRRLGPLTTLLALTGCQYSNIRPPAEKSIVQKMKDGGFNQIDLQRAGVADMQIWFGKHPEIARSVAAQCKAAMKDDSGWATSVEGRICLGERFSGYGAGR